MSSACSYTTDDGHSVWLGVNSTLLLSCERMSVCNSFYDAAEFTIDDLDESLFMDAIAPILAVHLDSTPGETLTLWLRWYATSFAESTFSTHLSTQSLIYIYYIVVWRC